MMAGGRRMIEGPDELISLRRAAELAGLTLGTMRSQASAGKLRTRTIGHERLTTLTWLNDYLNEADDNDKGTRKPRPDAYWPGIHVEPRGNLSTLLAAMRNKNPEWLLEDPVEVEPNRKKIRARHPETGFVKYLYYDAVEGDWCQFIDADPHFYIEP
jgi:hypothetical protein